jgi:hypothetical protein
VKVSGFFIAFFFRMALFPVWADNPRQGTLPAKKALSFS